MKCNHCDEPIFPGEESQCEVNGGASHYHTECLFRMSCGGILHQQGLCTCFVPHIEGPNCPCCHCTNLPDPEVGMTRREAAREALRLYREREDRRAQYAAE